MKRIVRPEAFEGNDHVPLLGWFGVGPKFRVRCGSCGLDFEKRIAVVDRPRVSCSHCGRVNELPLTAS